MNQISDATTDSGRLNSSSTAPITSAGISSADKWLGVTNRPSKTNSPIWASQPSPSANERVAARCGKPELASTTPARYAAMNPLACTQAAAANATIANANVAKGYSPDAGRAARRSILAPRNPAIRPIAVPATNS
nr:hypothetical protein CPGR_00037 [Mycolicibacter nonchromogenicus]